MSLTLEDIAGLTTSAIGGYSDLFLRPAFEPVKLFLAVLAEGPWHPNFGHDFVNLMMDLGANRLQGRLSALNWLSEHGLSLEEGLQVAIEKALEKNCTDLMVIQATHRFPPTLVSRLFARNVHAVAAAPKTNSSSGLAQVPVLPFSAALINLSRLRWHSITNFAKDPSLFLSSHGLKLWVDFDLSLGQL